MQVLVSFAVAYALLAVGQVQLDLGAGPLHAPLWTMEPTFRKMLVAGATWVARPFLVRGESTQKFIRRVAGGLIDVSVRLCVVATFVWLALAISGHLASQQFLRLVIAGLIVLIGAWTVLPLLLLVANVLVMVMMWPLLWLVDLVVPPEQAADLLKIRWCRNCRHYRKSKEFEDSINGLWRLEGMPRSDKLPCGIALEASPAWQRYFALAPGSRTLFPNDCELFERRA